MSIESLKQQARRHEQKEEWRKALDQYNKALTELAREEQVDIGLCNRVGDLHVRLGSLEAAVEHYEKAVDLYREADLPNNAIAICKKIIRGVPTRHEAYLRIGQIRAEQGFLSDARTNFLTYAERMQQTGRLDESFRALIEFCDLAPDDVGVRVTVAEQMAANGRSEQAVEQFLIARQHFIRTDEQAQADALEEKILAIDPDADLSVVPVMDSASDDGVAGVEGISFGDGRRVEPPEVPSDLMAAAEDFVSLAGPATDPHPGGEAEAGGLEISGGAELAAGMAAAEEEPAGQGAEEAIDGAGVVAVEEEAEDDAAEPPMGGSAFPDAAPLREEAAFDAVVPEAAFPDDVPHPPDVQEAPDPAEEPVRAEAGERVAPESPAADGGRSAGQAPLPESPPVSDRESGDEGYVDFGAMVLGGEESRTTRFTVRYEEPSGDEEADFARMLSQFKEKVSENLDSSDVRAHYDLGTAYKEMGLLDEAIGAFQAVLRSSAGHLPTYELMGQTFIEMGRPEAAVKSLRRALSTPSGVEDDLVGIYYYLGRAYEELDDRDAAVEYYDRVFSLDINFADVTERLRALR